MIKTWNIWQRGCFFSLFWNTSEGFDCLGCDVCGRPDDGVKQRVAPVLWFSLDIELIFIGSGSGGDWFAGHLVGGWISVWFLVDSLDFTKANLVLTGRPQMEWTRRAKLVPRGEQPVKQRLLNSVRHLRGRARDLRSPTCLFQYGADMEEWADGNGRAARCLQPAIKERRWRGKRCWWLD